MSNNKPKFNQECVSKLAEDHWNYVKEVLLAHNTQDDIVRVCEFHYISAFIHGFKHGVEYITENS